MTTGSKRAAVLDFNLAEPVSFDPRLIDPSTPFDQLMLTLALIFNDLKGYTLWSGSLLATQPPDDEVSAFAGQWHGMRHQIIRHVVALIHETVNLVHKEAKLVAMSGVFELLCSGEWAKERIVGAPIVSAEVEALAFIMKLSIPETQAALAAYPKEQRGKILANEEVVRGAAAIREGRKDAAPTSLDDFIS